MKVKIEFEVGTQLENISDNTWRQIQENVEAHVLAMGVSRPKYGEGEDIVRDINGNTIGTIKVTRED